MKPSLNLFWSFLKLLARKWVLWLFLALDGIAAIVQLLIPSFHLPQGVYIGVSIIGLVWASFETYLDLLSKIPDTSRPLTPEISMFFVEGSEYEYELNSRAKLFTADDQKFSKELRRSIEEETLPLGKITLHMRIENTGFVAVNLLTVSGDIDLDEPYQFMVPHAHRLDGTSLLFPIRLNSKESILFNIVAPIHPFTLLTDAQIAAQTRRVIDDRLSVDAKIFAEVIDLSGKTYQYKVASQLSLVPLCQMYIEFWKKQKRYDLAGLALGGNLSDADNINSIG